MGFRAPDLKYNDAMATVLQERGFLYDSSVPIDTTSSDFYYPYTLDHGAIEQSWKSRSITTPHPGVWEFPLPTLVDDDFTTITIQDPSGTPEEIIDLLKKNFGSVGCLLSLRSALQWQSSTFPNWTHCFLATSKRRGTTNRIGDCFAIRSQQAECGLCIHLGDHSLLSKSCGYPKHEDI